ncbi:DUF1592 domain-containing protein [Verrucomicrobia bacterium]|nr:DUF1592 domain-containing protein [Verrucomicrobiota bacterium]
MKGLVLLLVVVASGQGREDIKSDLDGFRQNVKPLLQKYCVDCHGPNKQKGDMRLDEIDPDVVRGTSFDQWEDVREAFNSGEMPPEEKPQPTGAERDLMTRWMDMEFKKVKLHGSTKKRGTVRRLTRYELKYGFEDLLGFSIHNEVDRLPEEGTSVETGLKNNSRMLLISSPHLESYLDVVMTIIERMKEIAVFEPFVNRADIANLDVAPPVKYTSEKKKIPPVLAKVSRAGTGIVIEKGGYLDLNVTSISKCKSQTSIAAKAESVGRIEVAMGFQRSDVDTRLTFCRMGTIDIAEGDELRDYILESYPEGLTEEFTKGDRPFFLRITNRGAENLYLESLEYRGNVNTELVNTLIPHDIRESEVDRQVRSKIASFVTKAFRRTPTEAELKKYQQVYELHAKEESPALALLSAYKEILCSPKFFYLGLSGNLGGKEDANFKLAERLAFFLWCSVPDEPLLKAAAEGSLIRQPELESQVQRMLKDEKSRRWVERFADQWLQTSQLGNVAVDRNYYPKFKDTIKDLMHRETYEAVNDVFRNGSPAIDLLKADHVFVNQTLASFYKLKGVRGEEFQKVAVDEKSHRGGLLTQGTFLIGNSDGMNSHAILRGVWLADVILHDPPPDPPANVPPLDENIPGFNKMTLNQKLFAHRNNEACRSCHRKIDPWGIPFENFDASGLWRTKVLVVSKASEPPKGEEASAPKAKNPAFEKNYLEIERKSTLEDGVEVDGIEKLKEYLINHRKRDFAKGLVERILAYGLSRDLDFHDEELVDELVDHFEGSHYSVPELIEEIVSSETFSKRK